MRLESMLLALPLALNLHQLRSPIDTLHGHTLHCMLGGWVLFDGLKPLWPSTYSAEDLTSLRSQAFKAVQGPRHQQMCFSMYPSPLLLDYLKPWIPV